MAKFAKIGTHLPVLQSIIEIFRPRLAMELGAGLYSTPLLVDNFEWLVSVENDQFWYKKICRRYANKRNIEIIYHPIEKHIHSSLSSLDINEVEIHRSFYQSLSDANPKSELLFVDQASCLRTISLMEMYRRFKFIVWHDADCDKYEYQRFYDLDLSDYNRYWFRLNKYATGFMIRKTEKYDETALFCSIKQYGKEYLLSCGFDIASISEIECQVLRAEK